MWKSVNGRLIQTVDDTRAEYKTRISKSLLTELKKLADEHNTHVGYLLETGFVQILKENYINFDKKNRPKDRVEFRTTCNKEVLENLREFAKDNKLNLNDVIETSCNLINIEQVKDGKWRYRIES
ncbi:rRNA methyltransferase [Ureibacillus chungkukjangi]|uniref:rRNA methyltransferase n=1 Tax=Ureibacillus chungkukjangi TaxID=1202712 RepID=UPI00203E5139|nr:rRNA methyltransferase [Ureibacillus chungkukjangi]MCM3387827.1 rRNA methyltransferase [Ureibacillus chungkukjangi]